MVILKSKILLEEEECTELLEYFKGENKPLRIVKVTDVQKSRYKYKFVLTIKSNKENCISLEIYDVNKKSNVFFDYYYTFAGLMNIKSVNDNNEGLEILFSIDIPYSKDKYKNKQDYYKFKLDILTSVKKDNLHNIDMDFIYMDFTNEGDVALASYYLLQNPIAFTKDNIVFDLYKSKLEYVGIELEDLTATSWVYTKEEIYEKLDKCLKASEVLNLLIGCVGYFKSINNIVDLKELPILGYKIYCKYISLLED